MKEYKTPSDLLNLPDTKKERHYINFSENELKSTYLSNIFFLKLISPPIMSNCCLQSHCYGDTSVQNKSCHKEEKNNSKF